MIGTILGAGYAMPVEAAKTPKPHGVPVPVAAPAPTTSAPEAASPSETIRTIKVTGNQRLEAETVLSYVALKVGDQYTREAGDTALKALYATELFADVQIKDENAGDLIIQVRENPVVNRIVLEGNKRLKNDKIMPEIKLSAREIFTRSKVRADVGRIIELYRRQGRYAATVDPQMVLLDQNRVDVVFEIHEGDKSKVRRINIIGNEHFSDSQLKGQMATKEATLTHFLSSGTSYDPDRMAYDQQKLRQFYLTQGYADFRVVSAVAELTPDKKDFIITYVVEEGKRYKFGDVSVQSDIRDIKPDMLQPLIKMKKGDWYNAKAVEDTVDSMTETAGLLGYAFANIDPDFNRDGDKLTMGVTYKVNQTPRVYVERIDINGNTLTQDKVVRREFRLSEGDAFNGYSVKRSRDRIRSLGYFQDKLEIDQKPGSAPDKVVLEANVQEKSTGQLQVSAGYSSLEKFIVSLSIEQNNFRGKGQTVRASADWSAYSKSVSLGFTEPYLFDKNLALGFDIFRRDYRAFDYTTDNSRNTTYNDTTTGFQVRLGIPLTEYWTLATRYGLSQDKVSLDKDTYYSVNSAGNLACDPIIAGRYLCDAVGNRTTSSIGYSLVYDNLNNRITPTAGNRFVFSQDFAGLGGSVKYVRTTVQDDKYHNLGSGFILNIHGEGGYIWGYGSKQFDDEDNELDAVRLTDRFQLGSPQIRGFDIRGLGPRVIRYNIPSGSTTPDFSKNGKLQDDALGGRAYYLGHLEMQLPLGSGAKEAGFKPSIYVDAGSVFGLKKPALVGDDGTLLPTDSRLLRPVRSSSGQLQCISTDGNSTVTTKSGSTCPSGAIDYNTQIFGGNGIQEIYYGGSWKPRISIGFGVSWNSPFGPLRIDIAKALVKQKGDDTKLFNFNVGTQF
ncbi:outer membrane protein assembly factor BamA [Sphingomonas sp. CGMCC 1.13654]|uniref:Outer membrane protein assembly factor BamA n=1 Tax=Sphingomonas chungangi TaxID=2683589 RepID=A0A838L885_9SPHN|nr:outer membrane protein assembly factor BamA [Sphingomonas chungangi]MBA2935683.1 outer membrane protein assembly factor BamA [Sphingomonas chungangi]MVW54373.1 outer membrane protein assembly factor BamA [Sphingomonas chungangi]